MFSIKRVLIVGLTYSLTSDNTDRKQGKLYLTRSHRSGLSELVCATPPLVPGTKIIERATQEDNTIVPRSFKAICWFTWMDIYGWVDGWMGCVSHLYRENLNVRGHGISRVRPNIGDWPVGNSRIKSERRMLLSQEDNVRKGIFTSGYVLVSAPGACNWHR